MRARSAGDVDWRRGRTPLFVFFNDEETYEIGREAYFEFFSENALGRKRAFFGIGSMEREVLDFGLDLFSAPEGAEGVFSCGGSESIFLALKAARDARRAEKGIAPGEGRMNVVMPITAHPAFDKAAAAMDLELRRGGLRADRRADPAALRPLIDERTIAIVGSAPCFPHGVIDPIEELSALALEAGVWLHVDACVGGWLAPFFTRIGRSTPAFDFRFPGVRSISADLHKFGFCPKPASTVFYRDAEDLARASFVADAWPNGRFETATLVGTRPGGAVAGAWAVLNHLGESGFRRTAERLAAMVDGYVAGIRAIPGLELWAEPDLTIINYGSRELDIFRVAEAMGANGWLAGLTREPKGLHAMMSMLHEPVREEFLAQLAEAVETVRAAGTGVSGLQATY
ncbi:pyridoxal phosphate-dependent decarboxylase family protein [Tistlia consotensis]|nr:pyridoxal-dependent decarboxylase [Tistlia consotensis]